MVLKSLFSAEGGREGYAQGQQQTAGKYAEHHATGHRPRLAAGRDGLIQHNNGGQVARVVDA